jgi:hypothetical protein
MPGIRKPLGGWSNAGSRGRVYLTEDAIEVDEADGWHIDRRRVFLDDILLVTLHRSRSWFGFWVMLCMAASILLIGAGVAASVPGQQHVAFYIGFSIVSSPFLLMALLFLRPFAVVTVVGRRTRTRMTWWIRHARAAANYHHLCQLAATRAQPAVAGTGDAPPAG